MAPAAAVASCAQDADSLSTDIGDIFSPNTFCEQFYLKSVLSERFLAFMVYILCNITEKMPRANNVFNLFVFYLSKRGRRLGGRTS